MPQFTISIALVLVTGCKANFVGGLLGFLSCEEHDVQRAYEQFLKSGKHKDAWSFYLMTMALKAHGLARCFEGLRMLLCCLHALSANCKCRQEPASTLSPRGGAGRGSKDTGGERGGAAEAGRSHVARALRNQKAPHELKLLSDVTYVRCVY